MTELAWHLVTKDQDYAFARPALVAHNSRKLELAALAPSRRGNYGTRARLTTTNNDATLQPSKPSAPTKSSSPTGSKENRLARGQPLNDFIRRAQHLADLQVVVQEWDELAPGALPQPDDRRVLLAPAPGHLVHRSPGRGRVHHRAGRLDVRLEAIPVLAGGQPEGVEDQDDAGLHRGQQPHVLYHLGQAP